MSLIQKFIGQADPAFFIPGFGATQGVFREYYFKTPPFEGNQLVASTGLLVVVSNMQKMSAIPSRRLANLVSGAAPNSAAVSPQNHRSIPPVQDLHDVERHGHGCGVVYRRRLLDISK